MRSTTAAGFPHSGQRVREGELAVVRGGQDEGGVVFGKADAGGVPVGAERVDDGVRVGGVVRAVGDRSFPSFVRWRLDAA
ncbi:hypothetical protein GCM10025787_19030 [Saccharopolyspora rosea]